jgi:hypothetical protein
MAGVSRGIPNSWMVDGTSYYKMYKISDDFGVPLFWETSMFWIWPTNEMGMLAAK